MSDQPAEGRRVWVVSFWGGSSRYRNNQRLILTVTCRALNAIEAKALTADKAPPHTIRVSAKRHVGPRRRHDHVGLGLAQLLRDAKRGDVVWTETSPTDASAAILRSGVQASYAVYVALHLRMLETGDGTSACERVKLLRIEVTAPRATLDLEPQFQPPERRVIVESRIAKQRRNP